MALKPKTISVPAPLPEYHYKTEPYFHQRHEFDAARDADVRAMFWEVGCAKSKPVIDQACDLYERGKIDTLLILAPNKVHRQWIVKEVPKHVPDRVPYVAAFYKSGLVNKPWKQAVENDTGSLRILAVNTEIMSHSHLAKMVWNLCKKRSVMAVLDESHMIMTPSSTRSLNVRKLRPLTSYRRILTGTEMGTGYENIYAQYAFLDPAIIGCYTYTEFKTKYCVEIGQYHEIVGYRNLDELKARIAPYTSMWEKKDCLDLPPFFDKIKEVELTDEQWRVYKDVRDEYISQLASGEIVEAPLAITRIQKLAQIAAGHVHLGGNKWESIEPTYRIRDTLEIINEAHGQVIVWCEWIPDIVQLSRAFMKAGISFVTYFGGNTSTQNDKNLDAFQSDPSIKVFIATAAGGVGLTINEADTTIFYDLGTNFIEYIQKRGRNHRPGQDKPVTYHSLVAPRTIDVKLKRMITNKQKMTDLFRDPEVFKRWLLDEDEVDYSHLEMEFDLAA